MALRFISRNPKLPITARLEAQIQLAKMPTFTRFTHIKNRCVSSGTANTVLKKFRLGRYQFRMQALEGDLPGVQKGSW